MKALNEELRTLFDEERKATDEERDRLEHTIEQMQKATAAALKFGPAQRAELIQTKFQREQ